MDTTLYASLNSLDPEEAFTIEEGSVKRLHDSQAEIHPGQEVAFVLTFALKVKKVVPDKLPNEWQLSQGDVLLSVGADGEPRSDKHLSGAELATLTKWLGEHLEFEVHLDGDHVTGAARIPDVNRPWMRLLTVAHTNHDHIKVEIKADLKSDLKSGITRTERRPTLARGGFALTLGDHDLHCELDLWSTDFNDPKNLAGQTLCFPLHTKQGKKLEVQLTIKAVDSRPTGTAHRRDLGSSSPKV